MLTAGEIVAVLKNLNSSLQGLQIVAKTGNFSVIAGFVWCVFGAQNHKTALIFEGCE
jgi:hypothetical protein